MCACVNFLSHLLYILSMYVCMCVCVCACVCVCVCVCVFVQLVCAHAHSHVHAHFHLFGCVVLIWVFCSVYLFVDCVITNNSVSVSLSIVICIGLYGLPHRIDFCGSDVFLLGSCVVHLHSAQISVDYFTQTNTWRIHILSQMLVSRAWIQSFRLDELVHCDPLSKTWTSVVMTALLAKG